MQRRLEGRFAERPADRGRVDAHKVRMLAEVRGHDAREVGEGRGLTRARLAESLGVGPSQVSRIERGDLEGVRIGTLRAHAAALGAELSVDSIVGDVRTRIG
ncbi:XRE family transcriptional regulator [Bacilli bacterium]|nr:XRE family transcriptional regulator [Bacilli bacterium]